jgi:hypothetical protein
MFSCLWPPVQVEVERIFFGFTVDRKSGPAPQPKQFEGGSKPGWWRTQDGQSITRIGQSITRIDGRRDSNVNTRNVDGHRLSLQEVVWREAEVRVRPGQAV